jgi:carboxypeptidase PM20D1
MSSHCLLLLLSASLASYATGEAEADRATSQQEFTSMQSADVDPVKIEVDINAAAERLAGGVRFPTISNEDRDDFDVEAFEGFHNYLKATFPNVHKTLTR